MKEKLQSIVDAMNEVFAGKVLYILYYDEVDDLYSIGNSLSQTYGIIEVTDWLSGQHMLFFLKGYFKGMINGFTLKISEEKSPDN